MVSRSKDRSNRVYQGFVRIGNSGGAEKVVILATGAGVNLVLEPIYSSSVWGAGWYNAATSAHYADAALRYEGTIDIEMQFGDAGKIWKWVDAWGIRNRAYPSYAEISPDGARVYTYDDTEITPTQGGLYNTSMGFSTSEGSFLTCSLGALALNRAETDPGGGTAFSAFTYLSQKFGIIASDCTELAKTVQLNPGGTNVNPIPFWRTQAQLRYIPGASATAPEPWTPFDAETEIQAGMETVEWSVDVSQNQVVVYTCNGSRLPTAVMMGPMDASGSVVLFNQAGVFDPILGPASTGTITSPFLVANNTIFRVKIDATAAISSYMAIPAVVVEGDDYGITGVDAVTNRTFNLKGLGGRCDGTTTLPPFIMSDYGVASCTPTPQPW